MRKEQRIEVEQAIGQMRAALDGIVFDGMLMAIGGFGLYGISEAADPGVARFGRARFDDYQQ